MARSSATIRTSERAKYLRRVKAARHANAAVRASGRVPCQEANAANAARRAASHLARVAYAAGAYPSAQPIVFALDLAPDWDT